MPAVLSRILLTVSTRSIESQIQLAKGKPAGFDYLRICLALSIIAWHTILVCYGAEAQTPFRTGPFRPLFSVIVPSFFALSGFLVAGSLLRSNIFEFLTLRAMRIMPALFCEVVISALLIGSAVTSLSYSEYFSRTEFYSYFLNIVGDIHYRLPGVFQEVPGGDYVNLQLWTVPYELECYAAITILALGGVIARSRWLVTATLSLTVFLTAYNVFRDQFPPMDYPPSGRLCLLSFLFGVALYVERGRIPFRGALFALSAIAAWVLLLYPQTALFAALPIAYVTVWLGLQNPRKIFFVNGADYSYGMYLYGFPLQQTIAYAFPDYRVWYFNFALALILAGLCAYLSWNLVERPVQEKRKRILAFVNSAAGRLRRPDTASPFRGRPRRVARRLVPPSSPRTGGSSGPS